MNEFEKLCQQNQETVYRYLLALCCDEHLAEELTAAGVDVRIIGDAKEPGLAGAAIREGYLLGRHL